ncbi:DUF4123 domain-containing protein [Pseudomonas putida]|uniref:DUF4123 domain-containing protein n=1 Tax=Pseudomonas putida TaxID=303 RepID=UPI0023637B62|nr:DUF4123 domain-containing protein [Pseudomonas putida]MDD1964720.1 DUF4123 domain-containing protein [Pseudomonas putida]
MTLHFACDPIAEGTAETLLDWMQSRPAPCFALIDMALLDAQQRQTLIQRHQGALVNAFASTSLATFGEHAPHLLTLSTDPIQRSAEVTCLLEFIGIAPALSWICSASPLAELHSLFGYLGKVQAEGRPRPMHCRFADVRVLSGLLDDLAPTQQRRIAKVIESWGWVNRDGHWRTWDEAPSSDHERAPDNEAWLHLSLQQFTRIDDRTEADGIFRQLMEQGPHTPNGLSNAQLHQRLQACLNTATTLHLACAQDRYEFVQLCLNFGDEFHRHEQLQPTWVSIRKNSDSLVELKRLWPEELWAALQVKRDIANQGLHP